MEGRAHKSGCRTHPRWQTRFLHQADSEKSVVRGPLVSPMADARKRYCRTFGGCCSLRGSNPRPLAHKTSALTTELRERLLTFEIKRKNINRLIARHCRGPVAGHATPTSSCHTSGPRNAPIASPPSPTAPQPRNATANTQSCEPMLGAQRNRTHESRMRRVASENQRVQAPYSQTRFMTAVGFEPTQLALAELESAPLDHSGMLSWRQKRDKAVQDTKPPAAGRRYELTSSAPERQAPPCHVHSRANKAPQRPE